MHPAYFCSSILALFISFFLLLNIVCYKLSHEKNGFHNECYKIKRSLKHRRRVKRERLYLIKWFAHIVNDTRTHINKRKKKTLND